METHKGATVYENARIVDPSRDMDETGSLVVIDGKIAEAGAKAANQGTPDGATVRDCTGLTIVPGLVDMRVYVGEPGAEHRETIASASAAAAAGGVTSLVMMPDTDPVIDDVALVEFVLRTARETAMTRVFPAAAITKGLKGSEMTEIGILLDAGAVLFTDGRQTIANAAVMRNAMRYAKDFGAVVAHETQDANLSAGGVMNEGLFASWLGFPGIPREAELLPLERDLRLAAMTRANYHAAKISTAMSADAIRSAKDQGLPVTAGVSINHLSLNENDIGEYRTFFKMSPPLRNEDDRLAMVEALKDGTIDVIVSSHDPQDVDTKRLPFSESADGAVGLETLLAAGLRLVHNGDVTLARLVEAMSTAPARLLGIDAGTLAAGSAADFAILDLELPWVLDEDQLRSRSKNTAFEGARFTGRVVETVVAGNRVYGA
ncbi:dihydroorotase [Oricola thermophila]|uniref:Dihydroorotase n=1 Tax=Oricola thermophila TaxID=2742145 RepID=A0A6N1VIE8_9HYPH|nr:dihydroorotase [Oricola thermophila]QKV20544.1 dihydroorotase [Oricola thermophila]